jgi:hypothetical protein
MEMTRAILVTVALSCFVVDEGAAQPAHRLRLR